MGNTIAITAEQIAAELRWRLSNSNAELEDYDIAYYTDGSDGQAEFDLYVQAYNMASGARGEQRFVLKVQTVR